jgi:hypothetical protein
VKLALVVLQQGECLLKWALSFVEHGCRGVPCAHCADSLGWVSLSWCGSSREDLLKDVLHVQQASSLLAELDQSPPQSTHNAMKGCSSALVSPTLLRHKDKEVGLLVAICISEIMRIVAPDAPYSDDTLKVCWAWSCVFVDGYSCMQCLARLQVRLQFGEVCDRFMRVERTRVRDACTAF